MTGAAAYSQLLRFGSPILTTKEAALRLHLSIAGASHLLRRLSEQGLVLSVRRGLWSLDAKIDRLVLAPYLTAPYLAYVSLQTGLYLHGLISQIPQVTYLCSLAATQTIETSRGLFSVHQLAPEFFGGFDSDRGFPLATQEKALLDVLYLSRARSRLFAVLPELEIPDDFDWNACPAWIARIRSPVHQRMVQARLAAIRTRRIGPAAHPMRRDP